MPAMRTERIGAMAPPVPINRPAADRTVSGDGSHGFGRRIARFRETDRTVSGDASHGFGRRIARFRETISRFYST
jgi:hypothetical protein